MSDLSLVPASQVWGFDAFLLLLIEYLFELLAEQIKQWETVWLIILTIFWDFID